MKRPLPIQAFDWPWKPEPDVGCLVRTLRRQGDPARVPFLELFADAEMISTVLGAPKLPPKEQIRDRETLDRELDQRISFWYRLGYDAFWQGAILRLPDTHRLMGDDTAGIPRQQRRWVDEHAGVITNWEEFERYPWPRTQDADLHPMEYVAQNLPEGMGLIAQISGVLEPAMWLMGYETFAVALYDQPDLIEAIFQKITGIYLPLARSLVQMDRVVGLWMGDDMGFRSGTMIAPAHLRRSVFPLHKQFAQIAHAEGIPFLLHSCGNLGAVMEDLIDDVGIDAKHSFEDAIEPVEVFAGHYGDRVAVIGGIDMDLLARGSPEDVRVRTRHVMNACAPRGGYILGSGNSIANYIPPQNFLAMLDEGLHFNQSQAYR